jgi:hypothetical protein
LLPWWFGRPDTDPVPTLQPPAPPPADRVELGAAAQRLLEDPVFALALGRVQERATENWRRSKVGDTAARETMYWLQAAIEELRSQLQQMVDNGKAAERE